ncbi:unnamed protein product, partial [Rhizoctonia solani]
MTPKEKYAGKNMQARRGKDKPKDLWTRRDNIELEHDSDDEVRNPSDLIPSPYTPTCKGYSLESDLVKEVSACCHCAPQRYGCSAPQVRSVPHSVE